MQCIAFYNTSSILTDGLRQMALLLRNCSGVPMALAGSEVLGLWPLPAYPTSPARLLTACSLCLSTWSGQGCLCPSFCSECAHSPHPCLPKSHTSFKGQFNALASPSRPRANQSLPPPALSHIKHSFCAQSILISTESLVRLSSLALTPTW